MHSKTTASLFFMCVFVSAARAQEGADLDQLIDSVFNVNNDNASNRNPVTQSPGDKCTCVAYYLCNNGTINKDGTGIIDIR